jgi:leucyl aminopeptidase
MSEPVFQSKTGQLEQQKSPCLVLPLRQSKKCPSRLAALDAATGGLVSRVWKNKDFSGERKQCVLLSGNEFFPRIVLLGLGDPEDMSEYQIKQLIGTLWGQLSKLACTEATLDLDGFESDAYETLAKSLARELTCASYKYTTTLGKKPTPPNLTKFILLSSEKSASAAIKRGSTVGATVGQGINYARELANLPGNFCTPTYLSDQAIGLAEQFDTITCDILGEEQMRELGMHSLLSVSAGSAQEAQLIVMHYQGAPSKKSAHCLVGKGITFDTGGISLKPGAKMDEMKFDMGGAASVFGTVKALASYGAKVNLVAIVAAAENMPSGTATKPGDVVTSMSGQTIEILNTDAEGRLVLCDALTYAERFKPSSVVDIATLTGACVVALGHHATGLYANNDDLAAALLAAGETTGDRAWRMPLWDEYQNLLDSPFADIGNIGGPSAGSVTAACFLSRFTKTYPWAHLDIAGTAWNSSPKGATGRPVALLCEYLTSR